VIALLAAASTVAVVVCWPPSRSERLRAVRRRASALRAWHALAVVAVVQLASMLLGVPVLAAVGVLVVFVAGSVLRGRRSRELRTRRQEATVEVVFALAAELHAGRTPAEALGSAADSGDVLRQPLMAAASVVRSGAPAAEPLSEMARLPGCEMLAAVGAVWQVTEQVGGAVADGLDRHGASLDFDIADRRAFEAALAGPRASMTMLAGLPALGLLMGQSAGARPLHLLLHRPLGWALLAGALVLELAGVAWSRRLVRGVLPP
jgi:tight adherence protein B